MTEEKRKDLVKKLNEKLENARISIRQIRDDIKKEIEEAEKNKEITEDDRYTFIEELDEEAENKNNELKEIKDKKEGDLMTV
jgi:ribosome recycling factor